MSFPGQGSIKHRICKLLEKGGMQKADIYDAPLNCGRKALPVAVYELLRDGLIEVDEADICTLAMVMRRHLAQCEVQATPRYVGQIAEPRNINRFTPEMTGYRLPTFGTRPEAVEIMQARSKHV